MPPKLTKSDKKKRKTLRRVSQKQAAINKAYSQARKVFLAHNPHCEFWGEEGEAVLCNKKAVHVHHMMGRGRYTLIEEFWLPVCLKHHSWIEDNKKAARKRGYILYK